MKCGIILVIIIGFLIGISNGAFVTDQIGANSPSWFNDYGPLNLSKLSEPMNQGWYDVDYESLKEPINQGWYDVDYESLKEPINQGWFGYDISEYLSPLPKERDIEPFQWEQVPLVTPEPLPLSKDELFANLMTVTENKQSLISSHKNSYYF
jgi:hypothetical protein